MPREAAGHDATASTAVVEDPHDATASTPMTAWNQRGADWKTRLHYENMTPLFRIEVARLALELPSCTGYNIKKICHIVARMVCPEKDISHMIFPSTEQVRQSLIKMDVLLSLRQRRLFTMAGIRVGRFMAPDSSPQGHYDYINVLEERMIRPWRPSIPAAENFGPFGGFQWERHTLMATSVNKEIKIKNNEKIMVTTVARGERATQQVS